MPSVETAPTVTDEHRSSRRDRRRRRSLRKTVTRLLLATALILTLFVGGAVALIHHWLAEIERIPGVFADLQESARPPTVTDGGQTTFLLMGLDVRADDATTGSDAAESNSGSRADAMMVVALQDDGSGVRVVSVPRDSWVEIPRHGMDKLNAAHAYGGPSLLVETVERITGVRIDHVATVDFRGFAALTDAVGGISVEVAGDTANWGHEFTEGKNFLDGERALWYIRQRMDLPGGDLDRVQRHQNFLRAMMDTLSSPGTYRSPQQVKNVVQAVTRNISLDAGLDDSSLLGLAQVLRRTDRESFEFFTAPVSGTGLEGDRSVVYLDVDRGAEFWRAVAHGDPITPGLGAKTLPAVTK
ncbi:LCP family protein [Prescottella defluvii]